MDRRQQLFDQDVRKTAPALDPVSFLDMYVQSNFPQTAALPSGEQRERGVVPQMEVKDVNLQKKIPSGTQFDRPQVS
jgi:hypothetical protein